MHTLLIDDVPAATVELRFSAFGGHLQAGGALAPLPAFDVIRPCFEESALRPYRETRAPSVGRPRESFALAIADAAGALLPTRHIRIFHPAADSPSRYTVLVTFDDAAAEVWAASLRPPRQSPGHEEWGTAGADA